MIAAHLSGIRNVKKFFIVVINLIHILGQCNLVQLIVMYAFMRNWSFQICLHMHPNNLMLVSVNRNSYSISAVTSGNRPFIWMNVATLRHYGEGGHPGDHSGYGLGQWKTLHCKVVCHWVSLYSAPLWTIGDLRLYNFPWSNEQRLPTKWFLPLMIFTIAKISLFIVTVKLRVAFDDKVYVISKTWLIETTFWIHRPCHLMYYGNHQWPILLTWFNFYHSLDK